MTQKKVTIHYQSPPGDPFKIPRPHRYVLDGTLSDKCPRVEGGEFGADTRLLGFCSTPTPNVDDWRIIHPDELSEDFTLSGWYAQFVGRRGGVFGYSVPVERVEFS